MKRFTLFLVFVAFSNTILKAQTEVVFQEKIDAYVLFNNTSSLSSNANQLIKGLAEGNGKSVVRTEFTVNFKQNLRITKDGNNHSLFVDISNLNPSGDINYRGFSLHQELIPSNAAFKIDVLDRNNNVVRKFDFKDVTIKNRELDLVEERFIDTLKRELKLAIYDLRFFYSNNAISNFNFKTSVINNYYLSDVPLANAMQLLQLVNPMDVDNIPMHQTNLLNCENIIADVNSKKIQENLPLNDFDPIQFNLKMNALQTQATAKRNAINFALATLHETYYNRGLEALANNQTLLAQKWFTRSLEVNPNFAPSLLQLAKIDFANGNLNDAEARVKDIFIKMNPDPQTQQYSGELAAKISSQYTALGEEQNEKGNYHQALNNLQRAKSVCSTIPGLVCNEKMQANIARAKNGIYSNIVKEGTKFFNEGNLKQAENKANEAYFYQRENNEEITSTTEVDALMAKVKQIEYNQVVTEAKTILKSKNYTKALQLFNTADELKQNYKLKHDVNFDKLRAEAAKPVLLVKVEEALSLASSNKLDAAKTNGKQIENQQTTYGLLNDKELNAKLDKLQEAIFAQECANALVEIKKAHNEAKQAVKDKAFIKADELYLKAIAIMEEYPMCNFATTTLRDEQVTNLPGATYQKLINQVIDLQDSYRYKEAVEKYIATEKYFYQLEVDKLGLVNLSLFDFGVKRGNVKWQQHLAQYFLDKKEYDKSLAMCKVLVEKGINPKNYKYTLYDLGKAYGTKDKLEKPSAKPKTEVLVYTQGNKKLSFFKKGYLKAF